MQCRINLAAKVAYAMGPALSRAPRSLWGSFFPFSCWRPFFFFFFFFFLACRFFPQGRMQDLPNEGGGGVPRAPKAPCRPMWRGGGVLIRGGGGAPMQALAPGRWRPSLYATACRPIPLRPCRPTPWQVLYRHADLEQFLTGRRDAILSIHACTSRPWMPKHVSWTIKWRTTFSIGPGADSGFRRGGGVLVQEFRLENRSYPDVHDFSLRMQVIIANANNIADSRRGGGGPSTQKSPLYPRLCMDI